VMAGERLGVMNLHWAGIESAKGSGILSMGLPQIPGCSMLDKLRNSRILP